MRNYLGMNITRNVQSLQYKTLCGDAKYKKRPA